MQAYAAATRLVLAAMGVGFVDGRLTLNPALAEYLKARGVIRPNDEDE